MYIKIKFSNTKLDELNVVVALETNLAMPNVVFCVVNYVGNYVTHVLHVVMLHMLPITPMFTCGELCKKM